MYTILNIVYGCPLTPEIIKALEEESTEPEDYFVTLYTGSGNSTPGYIGVDLKTVDEISNFNLTDLYTQC